MKSKIPGVRMIAAVDKNWGIGQDGKLLVRLPGDLKYFREKTLGGVLIMGRVTLESLPGKRPLPGRTTIVLSKSLAGGVRTDYGAEMEICDSVEACLRRLEKVPRGNIFVAGGESVYRQFLPYCADCLVTKIDGSFGADRFFEDLDANDAFELAWESPLQEENGIKYVFSQYDRKENK
ncbi:MAG: dihydrofolate reductase [Clostridiales Family XIII bacterium]|jgi:dihydrofolate reductase|nr:dihydrofolate reductase [Clostridiales Family XIII bacterium]